MKHFARFACLLGLLGASMRSGATTSMVESSAAADDFAKALALYHARHYTEARCIFERLAAAQPERVELDFYLGRLALWFDDEAGALSHLERAARLAPRDARIQNALGDAYGLAAQNASVVTKLNWAWKCRAAYDRAVELDPNNPAYHWSRLGFFCVAPRIAGGGDEKAAAEAEAIKRLDPPGGRIAFATLYLAEKKFDLAFAQVDALARERREDFLALYHIGRCAALSGQQLKRGRAALEHCLALPPPAGDGMPTRAAVHYRLANILEKTGDAAAAQAEYTAARAEDPDFRPAKIALKG